jgi:hypothetical protein
MRSQNALARDRGREARRSKRKPKRHAAWISLNSTSAHIPCVLWDISDGGARLAAPRSNVLPAMFNLILSKDGSSQRLCKVVWRNEAQVGVQFLDDQDVDLDYPRNRSSKKAEAVKPQGPRPTQQEIVAGCSLGIQARSPAVAAAYERKHVAISSFAFVIAVLLTAATALFSWASQQVGADAAWAVRVCGSARNFCDNPEWTGAAAALMAFIYLSARGMER